MQKKLLPFYARTSLLVAFSLLLVTCNFSTATNQDTAPLPPSFALKKLKVSFNIAVKRTSAGLKSPVYFYDDKTKREFFFVVEEEPQIQIKRYELLQSSKLTLLDSFPLHSALIQEGRLNLDDFVALSPEKLLLEREMAFQFQSLFVIQDLTNAKATKLHYFPNRISKKMIYTDFVNVRSKTPVIDDFCVAPIYSKPRFGVNFRVAAYHLSDTVNLKFLFADPEKTTKKYPFISIAHSPKYVVLSNYAELMLRVYDKEKEKNWKIPFKFKGYTKPIDTSLALEQMLFESSFIKGSRYHRYLNQFWFEVHQADSLYYNGGVKKRSFMTASSTIFMFDENLKPIGHFELEGSLKLGLFQSSFNANGFYSYTLTKDKGDPNLLHYNYEKYILRSKNS
jgi:hypothetical protein